MAEELDCRAIPRFYTCAPVGVLCFLLKDGLDPLHEHYLASPRHRHLHLAHCKRLCGSGNVGVLPRRRGSEARSGSRAVRARSQVEFDVMLVEVKPYVQQEGFQLHVAPRKIRSADREADLTKVCRRWPVPLPVDPDREF